jgi:hypothetical protein
MHPRTPKRLEPFAETHRQVGAICHAGNWMEAQLEIAVSELSRVDDLTETQGDRWLSLVKRLKALLKDGAVTDEAAVGDLRDLLSRISAAMSTRDQIVHSTWMFTNCTKPGYITGQRWRSRGVQQRDWHPDELEQVREHLETLVSELSSAAWIAVMPPDKWL